jgi:hypothetical protein
VLLTLDELSSRFLGVDIQYRRDSGGCTAGWPAQWRARLLTSKNERSAYRVVAYGKTLELAVLALSELVNRIDRGQSCS